MSQTVWITGVTGFTGKYLVRYLNSLPDALKIIGLSSSEHGCCHGINDYHQLDITDLNRIIDIARQEPPDIVFHLASVMPPTPEERMWSANVGGTVKLLRSLATGTYARIVCIGSAAEYLHTSDGFILEDSPSGGETPYGRTKWAQTSLPLHLGIDLGMDISVVRPFNIIGPELSGNLVVGRICNQFSCPDTKEVRVGNI